MECENLFTGWADVKLSKQGIEEAQSAGKKFTTIKLKLILRLPLYSLEL